MGNGRSGVCRTGFVGLRARRVLCFLGVFAVVYGVLMALWPAWGEVYSEFYTRGAAVVFESFGTRAAVRLHRSSDAGHEVKITFYDRKRVDGSGRPIPLLRVAHDIRYGGYIYLAFLVALIVATPVPRGRKVWALLCGMVLMHVFMLVRLGILILYLLASERVSLLSPNWFWRQVLVLSTQVFTVNVLPGFVVAIGIWALVTLRAGSGLGGMRGPRDLPICPERRRAARP